VAASVGVGSNRVGLPVLLLEKINLLTALDHLHDAVPVERQQLVYAGEGARQLAHLFAPAEDWALAADQGFGRAQRSFVRRGDKGDAADRRLSSLQAFPFIEKAAED